MVHLIMKYGCQSYMEVGTKQGRMLCDVVRRTGIQRAYGVDAFKVYDEVADLGWDFDSIRTEYMENVARLPQIQTLEMWSLEAAAQFQDDPVDLIFIDAGHTYDDVVQDIPAWLPHCGKIMAGHDYDPDRFPGVCEAVDEHFPNVNLGLDFVWWSDTLAGST